MAHHRLSSAEYGRRLLLLVSGKFVSMGETSKVWTQKQTAAKTRCTPL